MPKFWNTDVGYAMQWYIKAKHNLICPEAVIKNVKLANMRYLHSQVMLTQPVTCDYRLVFLIILYIRTSNILIIMLKLLTAINWFVCVTCVGDLSLYSSSCSICVCRVDELVCIPSADIEKLTDATSIRMERKCGVYTEANILLARAMNFNDFRIAQLLWCVRWFEQWSRLFVYA